MKINIYRAQGFRSSWGIYSFLEPCLWLEIKGIEVIYICIYETKDTKQIKLMGLLQDQWLARGRHLKVVL